MRTIKSMNQSLASDLKKLEALPLNLFRLRLANLAQEFTEELGVSYRQLKIKPMRSRWGSCTSAGVITINSRLKDLPPVFLEYVLWHECLHLIHKNHGAGFRAALVAKFPGWRQLNQELKVFGTQLRKQ